LKKQAQYANEKPKPEDYAARSEYRNYKRCPLIYNNMIKKILWTYLAIKKQHNKKGRKVVI